MKNIIIAVLLTFSLQGFAQGIEFRHGTWAEIKEMAAKENKLIFVDFYTDWCAPCKQMSAEIFPQKEAGDFYNAHFISVKIDAEKGEGPDLQKKYSVGGYPTLVFTNPAEEIVCKVTGSADVKELIAQGKLALEPQTDYAELAEKYKAGTLGKEDMLRYLLLEKAKRDSKATSTVFDTYLARFPAIDTVSFDMIRSYVSASESPSFKYLEAHRNEFAAVVGDEAVDSYIRNFLLREVRFNENAADTAYAAMLQNLHRKVKLTEKETLVLASERAYALRQEDAYMKAAKILVERYYYNDDHEISNVLGSIRLPFIKKPENLLLMKKWGERALVLKDNSLNAMTLAFILSKLNDKAGALKYADRSLASSKRDNDGYAARIGEFRKELEK